MALNWNPSLKSPIPQLLGRNMSGLFNIDSHVIVYNQGTVPKSTKNFCFVSDCLIDHWLLFHLHKVMTLLLDLIPDDVILFI